jgi:hypothetical protein
LQVNTIAAEIGSTGQKLMAIALLALGFAKRELRVKAILALVVLARGMRDNSTGTFRI